MENLEQLKKVRIHFQTWGPERQKVLEDLKIIRDEVQRQARIHSIGSITYSSVGLVGGALSVAGVIAAPFTFGASLALTVAGAATGVTSGVASVTHGAVRIGIVKQQIEDAKASLKQHNATCDEMKRLIILLKTEIKEFKDRHCLDISHESEIKSQIDYALALHKPIKTLVQRSKAVHVFRTTGSTDEVAKLVNLGNVLDDIVPSFVKNVAGKAATKIPAEALSALAVLGILADLYSIVSEAKDLHENQELCAEAEKIQNVIEQMQREYDVLKKYLAKENF